MQSELPMEEEIELSGITYSQHIAPIMSANCVSCHGNNPSNGAPMSLTTAAQVKSAIQNNGLISSVESGNMPPSGSLSPMEIASLKTWETEGFTD
ncbi:MAG: c-type cytochrome [Flavobacteriaceae bacterium]